MRGEKEGIQDRVSNIPHLIVASPKKVYARPQQLLMEAGVAQKAEPAAELEVPGVLLRALHRLCIQRLQIP
ncbi:hypothetical protein AB1N83_008108 [Pleurotus pulmonarius]